LSPVIARARVAVHAAKIARDDARAALNRADRQWQLAYDAELEADTPEACDRANVEVLAAEAAIDRAESALDDAEEALDEADSALATLEEWGPLFDVITA